MNNSPLGASVTARSVDRFVQFCIETYGRKTIEDRSIPDFRDGLKPVQRRILWAMYDLGNHDKMVKAAKIIGHTMGNYHPHGDMAIHGAITTLVNLPTPLIEGQGNWGNPATGDNPAAPRYVEARLSKFSRMMLLDPDYLEVTDFVPNFDSSSKEPVVLPALLPTVFLTGAYGIAVGVSTSYPIFSLKFVADTAAAFLTGKEPRASTLAKKVQFDFNEGGNCITSHEEIQKLLETGSAAIEFEAVYEVLPSERALVVRSNAAKSNIELKMKKIGEIPEVRSVMNQTTDKIQYRIEFKPTVPKEEVSTLSESIIKKHLTTRVNFSTVITERKVSESGDEVDVEFSPANVIEIFRKWAEWRKSLEVAVLKHKREKINAKIARLELLLKASLQVVELAKEVAKKADNLKGRVAKLLSVSGEEADVVLSTPIRQLANMEQAKVKSNIKEFKAELSKIKEALKDPGAHCASQITSAVKLLKTG